MWMAYALFCRTPLAAVDIDADYLRTRDVESMAQILAARNPMALLFPEETDTQWPRAAVTAQVYLYDPHDAQTATRPAAWVNPTPCTYQVLGASRNGVLAVLVPGWGKAWVHEDTATISAWTPPVVRSPIRIMFLSMQIETMDAVLALLGLVGHDLKHLKIDDCTCINTPLNQFSERVILACPNLEELELCNMDLDNFQFVIDAFHATRFAMLQRLTLFAIKVRDRDAVERILAELSNPRTRMAIQLRALDVFTRQRSDHSATVPDSALRMLSTNSRLRDVKLALPELSNLAADVQARFKSHNLSTVSEPLPQRSILAFLSVVASARDATQALAMARFDSHICSHIVSLASSFRIRCVHVSAP